MPESDRLSPAARHRLHALLEEHGVNSILTEVMHWWNRTTPPPSGLAPSRKPAKNLKGRNPKIIKALVTQVEKLREQGLTYPEIATQTGYTLSSVYYTFKKYRDDNQQ